MTMIEALVSIAIITGVVLLVIAHWPDAMWEPRKPRDRE